MATVAITRVAAEHYHSVIFARWRPDMFPSNTWFWGLCVSAPNHFAGLVVDVTRTHYTLRMDVD